MLIVSFQKTVDAVRDGTKTVTRRYWKPSHAAKFKVDTIFAAWTAGPRNGGEFIRKCRVTKEPYREDLYDMTREHFEREGGMRYWLHIREFIADLLKGKPKNYSNPAPFVLEFDYEVE